MDIIEQNIFDNCVCCGELTEEIVITAVNFRNNYIEGVGQLCNKCALENDKKINETFLRDNIT